MSSERWFGEMLDTDQAKDLKANMDKIERDAAEASTGN